MVSKIKEKISIQNILFILLCGLMLYYSAKFSGISNVKLMIIAGAYILIRSIYMGHLKFDMNMLVLFEGFVIKAMLDQHTGKAWKVPTTLAMPVLMYLLGKVIATVKYKKNEKKQYPLATIARGEAFKPEPEQPPVMVASELGSELRTWIFTVAIAIGLLGFARTMLAVTEGSVFQAFGYYVLPYSDEVMVDKYELWFGFIPVVSIVLACLAWSIDCLTRKCFATKEGLLKRKWIIYLAIYLVAFISFLVWYVRDIRFQALKEAINLMITEHWGNFHFTVMPIDTSSNMWIDYYRESGILVGAFLIMFFVMIIKDAIQLVINANVTIQTKTLLISMFTLFNIFYFIQSTAFDHQFFWFFGLMVSGMISTVKDKGH